MTESITVGLVTSSFLRVEVFRVKFSAVVAYCNDVEIFLIRKKNLTEIERKYYSRIFFVHICKENLPPQLYMAMA